MAKDHDHDYSKVVTAETDENGNQVEVTWQACRICGEKKT